MLVLVAYASKHGATGDIARRIGRSIEAAGASVDVLDVKEVGDARVYDAFVIGSAVYVGRWMKEAAEFVRRNRALLAGRPVWLFSSGPLGNGPVTDPITLSELAPAIHPRGHRLFAGVLARGRLGLVERAMIKMVKAPEGDYRDWPAIESWAATIALELSPGAVRA